MRVNVAVRGSAADVRAAVESVGATRVDDETDADAVLAVGEDALLSLAERPVATPVLPVGVDAGRYAVATDAATEALESLSSGSYWTERHASLAADVDGETVGHAVTDVTLVRSEPAKISGYRVSTTEETLARFRSDGVVAATPLGSTGYARAAGGPVLAPGTGVVVVPIGPFSTRSSHWVLRPDLGLTVDRREGDVTLLLDGREVRRVGPDTTVRLRQDRTLSLLRVSDGGRDWKNSNE
jgi:NAD+ kinase